MRSWAPWQSARIKGRDFSNIRAAIESLTDYERAFEDDACKKDAAVNFVSLWVLLNFFIKTTHYLLSEESAAVRNLLSVIDLSDGKPVNNERYRKKVCDLVESLEKCNGGEKVSEYVRYLKEELAARYNEAVETIWIYQGKINELKTENDLLFDDYDHVSNLLYGS